MNDEVTRHSGRWTFTEVMRGTHDYHAQRRADRYGNHALAHLLTQTYARAVTLSDDSGKGVVHCYFDVDVRVIRKHLRQLGPKDIVRSMLRR